MQADSKGLSLALKCLVFIPARCVVIVGEACWGWAEAEMKFFKSMCPDILEATEVTLGQPNSPNLRRRAG